MEEVGHALQKLETERGVQLEALQANGYCWRTLLIRGMLLGSGVWHNTGSDLCHAYTPSAEGRLLCRSTRMSLRLSRKKPSV
jgi:hypothetical protein